MSQNKLIALKALYWLFEGRTCTLSVGVWAYTVLWYIAVLMVTDAINPTAEFLERVQLGWRPGLWWSTGILVATTMQTLSCIKNNWPCLVNVILSIVSAAGVIYSVLMPIVNTVLVYQFFPIASIGSILMAFAAIIIVARNIKGLSDG